MSALLPERKMSVNGSFAPTAAIPEGPGFDPEMDVRLLAICFDEL
jgi:hypothetical protein